MVKKIAINGFGRIGRLVYRIIEDRDDMEVIAINDLSTPEELSYLLKYDTNHRRYEENVLYDEEHIIVNNKKIKIYKEMDPVNLPWRELGVDIVLECTGKFTEYDKAMKHIEAGAKKVLISAPGKGNMKTIVYNVNDDILTDEDIIVSAASCTTNCLAPVLKVLDDNIGIVKGNMTTIHAYTNDQVTLDVPHKKGIYERRGRACAMNMIPASTGAAKAIGKVLPNLDGKILGSAIRVPVSDGSLIDLTLELKRNTSKEEINEIFKNNVNETLKYTEDPIVSSDIISSSCGATLDSNLTNVINVDNKQLVHLVAWYDNEMGYSYQMVRTLSKM
ncbi:MAG: type I glyceraldehyde-3-phosphate dehydrogenase [Bacilli bacterium]|nr:type I glyceraldehyde-3-phosphate dehydrogenase [Bacilli bacterium]